MNSTGPTKKGEPAPIEVIERDALAKRAKKVPRALRHGNGGTHPFDPNDQIGFSFQWASLDEGPVAWELWVDDVSYVF